MRSAFLTYTKSRPDLLVNLYFVLFVLATLGVRIFIFINYNSKIIDSDQPYMWIGASDFAKGHFYEPRYYAQDYNTFMEALFAVPFIWMKLPVYYAVPIATHLIFLFPFLFSAFCLFFHQKKTQAILVLAVILCLPLEYDVLTSLPRGFVTGLFFTSFFVLSILKPDNLRLIALNTILALTGYFVSPNSVLVSVPFLFYIFLHHFKNPRYYITTVLCLCTILPLYLFFDQFYKTHRDYVMNDIHYSFSWHFFLENISDLDRRFAHLSFFRANNCLALLGVLLLLAIALYRRNKKAFASFWVFSVVILFSFCSGKTTEGSTWVYMSYGRMYLGIPLFICLFLCVFDFRIKKLSFVLFCIPLLFSAYKLARSEKLLAWHYDNRHYHGVKLFSLQSALEAIDFYKGVCKERHAELLLISNRFWLNNVICYGGPAIYDDYPLTQETKLEKRYWVRAKNNPKVFTSFVMVSSRPDLGELLPTHTYFQLKRIDDYGLLHVTGNTLKTEEVIRFINLYEPYD